MNNKFNVLITGIFIVATCITASGQNEDSLNLGIGNHVIVNSNFEANLDSMLNLYYVNHSLLGDTAFFEEEADTVIPDFPDSVYIDRISKIPSVVELSYNTIVRRYIEVYTQKRRKSVEVMLGLSEYYFPVFDEIFDMYDIPSELKYMSIIESALNPRAYSRARAVGLWQFMYGTGKRYGLTINSLVDERKDPILSTHAAARFINDLYIIYNDWILVIAAYNCGPGNVNKAVRRSGGKRNYWDLYYYLPRETRGHVPAYIAATYTMHYYREHNLQPRKIELPVNNDTVMINEELHLKQVSEVLGIPVKQLRDMNPQYRTDVIPAKDRSYSLRLPLEKIPEFIDLRDSIYAYKDSVYFDPNKIITSPTVYTSSKYMHEPPSDNLAKLYYTVKSGDNLGYIASWYNVRVSDLRYWNNIRRNLIRSGQKLKVYVPKTKVGKYKKINSMSFAEKQKMIGKTVTADSTPEKVILVEDSDYLYYTVKQGDTLWDIARKYSGVTDTDIMRLNNISNPGKIKPGQRLKIKPKEGAF
jgi:membrane-bound lytic murein transglycosylase D